MVLVLTSVKGVTARRFGDFDHAKSAESPEMDTAVAARHRTVSAESAIYVLVDRRKDRLIMDKSV
jgi:hypothetical protein